MQHKLLFSDLRHSAEAASFLETIRDSSSGEYPHRAAAMEQIFERVIRDCRERVFTQAGKYRDPVVQPSHVKKNPPPTAPATIPTTTLPPPLTTKFEPAAVQPPDQSLQTQQGLQKAQPSHNLGSVYSIFSSVPTTQPSTKPPQTPGIFGSTSSEPTTRKVTQPLQTSGVSSISSKHTTRRTTQPPQTSNRGGKNSGIEPIPEPILESDYYPQESWEHKNRPQSDSRLWSQYFPDSSADSHSGDLYGKKHM